MIDFSCPVCGNNWKVADEHAGKVGKCKSCKTTIKIPTPVTAKLIELAPAVLPAQPAPEPKIVYVDRPVPTAYNVTRFIIVISSTLGALATFMPWITAPVFGSVNGARGDGWYPFWMHVAMIALALPGLPYAKIWGVLKFWIVIASLGTIVFMFLKLRYFESMQADEDSFTRAVVQVGFGLYLSGITGVVNLITMLATHKE